MTANMLSQAIELARAGKKEEARKILVQILSGDLHNEAAWLWLAETVPTNYQRRATLEKCLEYNPNSQVARRALENMRSSQADPNAAPTSTETLRPLMEAIRKPAAIPSPLEKADTLQGAPPASPDMAEPVTTQAKPKPKSSAKRRKTAKLTDMPEGETRPQKKSRRGTSSLKKIGTLQDEPSALPPPVEKADTLQGEPSALPPSPVKADTLQSEPSVLQPSPVKGDALQGEPSALPPSPVKADTLQREPSVLPPAPVKVDPFQTEPTVLPSSPEKSKVLKGKPSVLPPPPVKVDPFQTEPTVLPSSPEKSKVLKGKPSVLPPAPEKVSAFQTEPAVLPTPLKKADTRQSKPPLIPAPLKKVDAIQSKPSVSPTEEKLANRLAMIKPASTTGDPKAAEKPDIPAFPAHPAQKPPRAPPPPPPKKNRRMNAFDAVMISLIVLFLIGIAGFLLWGQYGPTLIGYLTPGTSPDFVATAGFLETQNAQMRETLTGVQARQLTNARLSQPTQTPSPTASATSTPVPTIDPNNPSLLFVDEISCTVKQISLSGGVSLTVTGAPPQNCQNTQLSPDGKKLSYLVQEGDPSDFIQSLYVMNVDGSSPVKVLDRAYLLNLVDWSPDSNWLSYTAVCGENQSGPMLCLNLVSADGTANFQLTDNRSGSIDPAAEVVSWSPDGLWLAFIGDQIPQIIRSDGSGLAKLANEKGYLSMVWSPDSQKVAYYSPDGAGIRVVDLHANELLLHSPSLAAPQTGQNLAWTPDGKQLVYLDTRLKALALVSLDSLEVKPLVQLDGWVNHLAWSPDGGQLAFIELPDASKPVGALKVINADGSGERVLVDSLQDAPFVWKMPGEAQAVTPIAITPPTPTNTPVATPISSLSQGLRLYYNFDADPQGLVKDWSGNGLDGTLKGGDYSPIFGSNKALTFSGTSISLNDPFGDTSPEKMTVALFFKPTLGVTFPGTLLAWSDGHASGIYLNAYMNWKVGNTDEIIEGTGADLIGPGSSGSVEDHYIATTSLRSVFEASAASWHHLAVTYDQTSGIAQLYIDGVLNTSKNLGKFVPVTGSYGLTIGNHPAQSGTEFTGMMDEIRIYERVLTAAEIKKLAAITPPK